MLTVHLTESAKRAFRDYLKDADSDDSVLGIIKGKWSDESTEAWQLSLYNRENANLVAQQVREAGFEAFHIVEDLELFIPQFQLLDELEGNTMDFCDGRITVA